LGNDVSVDDHNDGCDALDGTFLEMDDLIAVSITSRASRDHFSSSTVGRAWSVRDGGENDVSMDHHQEGDENDVPIDDEGWVQSYAMFLETDDLLTVSTASRASRDYFVGSA
jgi:hypothetical protein